MLHAGEQLCRSCIKLGLLYGFTIAMAGIFLCMIEEDGQGNRSIDEDL
jgi:hypothetical protein